MMYSKCANMAAPQRASYQNSMDTMLFGGAAPKQRAVTLKRSFNAHNNFLANAGHLTANQTNIA